MLNTAGIKELSTSPGVLKGPDIPDFDISQRSKRHDWDLGAEVERMARQAREKQRQQAARASGLALIADDMEIGLIDEEAGVVLNKIDKQVREARRLIDCGKYAEAAEILENTLREAPGHIEAIYWQAHAFEKLECSPDRILRLLLPLANVPLNPGMAKRVEKLRTNLRPVFGKWLVETFSEILENRGMAAALELARESVTLDSRSVQGYALWAGGLLASGEPAKASEAALEGIKRCRRDETEQLEKILSEARRRLLEEKLVPAAAHFKGRRYAQAHSSVMSLDAEYREIPLCQRFLDYLEALRKHEKKSIRELPGPSGTAAEVEELHEFLVRRELSEATKFMAMTEFGKATEELSKAVNYAPHY